MVHPTIKHPISSSQQGFSLTELSIVLLIISLMMGSILVLVTGKTQDMQLNETNATLKAVNEALAAYVAENRSLLCPSDITAAVNTAAFGIGNCSYQTGGVPTKTLQLPDEYAFDAWNRRITYRVVSSCANADGFVSTSTCPGSTGLTVNNAAGTATTTTAAYVLVSHGANGYGAWPHNGGTQISYTSASANEQKNATGGSNSVFVQMSPIITSDTTTTFDDIVSYGTQQLLIWRSGGLNGMAGNTTTIPNTISPICALLQTGNLLSNAGAISVCGTGNTSCSNALWSSTNTGLAVQAKALCF